MYTRCAILYLHSIEEGSRDGGDRVGSGDEENLGEVKGQTDVANRHPVKSNRFRL